MRLRPLRRLAVLAVATALAAAGTTGLASPHPARSAALGAFSRADLVNYLQSITGSNVVSGQHNREPNAAPSQWTAKVHDITGQYPGLWGGDFLFEQSEIDNRSTMVNQAKVEWSHGSLVALMWHMCPPTMPEPCGWNADGIQSDLTDAQWDELVTNGSNLNNVWKQQIDKVVPYLQDLKSNGIPVLWRPLHEMNDGWAWWGGRPGPNGSARLYQLMHDYLVDVKGLTNLVWVWNVKDLDGPGMSAYYPGASYVDVVSLDAWMNNFPAADLYTTMLNIAAGKPIAIAEVGHLPTPAQMASQPRWTYFMAWAEYLTNANTTDEVKATYYDPRVLNQGQVNIQAAPVQHVGPINGYAGKCVDVHWSQTANGTPIQLYTCTGGQSQAWTVQSGGSLRALGKCADVTAGGRADGTKVQLWDCNGTGAQVWQWNSSTRELVNPNSGKCLDVTGPSSADGTPLQIWTCTGGDNQKWTLP